MMMMTMMMMTTMVITVYTQGIAYLAPVKVNGSDYEYERWKAGKSKTAIVPMFQSVNVKT